MGDYRIEIIPDTEFRLDGGAMFGVVPRVLWERVCPPDDLNRIRLNMNCLFIDTGKEKILIETGIGEKWSAKQTEMYGIFREKKFADSLFEIAGCRAEDISIVVNTHLHFDHAGGNTLIADRDVVPQFPNARYFVSEGEFSAAEDPHERDKASYLSENWRPLQTNGQLELKPDTYEVTDGLRMETVRGHSQTMQTARLDRGGKTLYGFYDMVPTRHHLRLPWIMGYDLYPTETLEFKKTILPKALAENWVCHFYHDKDWPLCTLHGSEGKIEARELAN